MSESMGEGLLSEAAEDIEGVAETGEHAVEGVLDAASGNWDAAADDALSMSESALGVATMGLSKEAEKEWDKMASSAGLPTAHEALHTATQAAGNALGDGLERLVGDDQALKSANAFDDGDILGGLGHMAEGAGQTIEGAVEHGMSELGSALGDLFGAGQSGQGGAVDPGQPMAADATANDGSGAHDAGGYDPGGYDPGGYDAGGYDAGADGGS